MKRFPGRFFPAERHNEERGHRPADRPAGARMSAGPR